MANVHKPSENIKSDVAMNQATLNNSANTPTYYSLANYDRAWFLVFTGARTGAASLTCQMRQRIGTAGTEANLGTAATVTTANAVDATLFARGEDLTVNSGYDHVGILITETAVENFVVGALLLRMRARYKQATLPA
jgi:hypothetical protein